MIVFSRLLSLPTSQLQVFFGVWDPSLFSLTHLGSPGRVVMKITATPLALRLARETPRCEHAGITKKRTPLLKKKKRFLGYFPDNDASRVVCMGCPTVVLSLCFFILVLVTQSCFLCLHITVYKLLLVSYFRVFIAQPIWIWFMIILVRAFELLS